MFKDRIDAGKQLAGKLEKYKGKKDCVVVGIPRGGAAVASVVSKALDLPLDVIIVKKIGSPGNEEFAIGAAGVDSFHVDDVRIKELGIDKKSLDEAIWQKQKEAKERYDFLFEGKTSLSLSGKDVILIDDGIATGETMNLAVDILRKKSVGKIVVAVPVASSQSLEVLNADEVVCVLKLESLGAVGEFYSDFSSVEDSDVKKLLKNG